MMKTKIYVCQHFIFAYAYGHFGADGKSLSMVKFPSPVMVS